MASAAHAAVQPNVTCGQVITASITLNKNLTCPGTAFYTGGNAANASFVIDLGGHTVTSSNQAQYTIGIVSGSTTIQDGRISGGGIADVYGGGGGVFQNLTIDGGMIISLNGHNPVIENDRFINGAHIYSDLNTVDIESNTFVNGPAGTIAMSLFSTYSTVLNNTISGYGTGVLLEGDLSGANIQGNHISGVHGDGVQIGGDGATSAPGIVSNNVANNNAGDGIVLADGSGIGHQPGLLLVASNNTTNGNSHDGIHVDATKPQPGAVGLNVKLLANTANSNINLGIDSPGSSIGPPPITIIDGGGNTAKGNGQKIQCANIGCTK